MPLHLDGEKKRGLSEGVRGEFIGKLVARALFAKTLEEMSQEFHGVLVGLARLS